MEIDFELNETESEITLLYVEDDEMIRTHFSRLLSRRFPKILVAADGVEGLELYRAYRPDIVITDIRMPRMNGLEMATQIRQLDRHARIILTTAHSESDYLLQAIKIGVSQFVIKPINTFKLANALAEAVQVIRLERRMHKQNRLLQDILDAQESLILVGTAEKIIGINKPLMELLGFVGHEEAIEHFQTPEELMEGFFVYPSGKPFLLSELLDGHHRIVRHIDGERARLYQVKMTYSQTDRRLMIISMTDVTTLEQERRKYEKQATIDALTGIYNRLKFNEILTQEISRFERYGHPLALIMFDIDHFKAINDTLGHQQGDRILVELATLIAKNLRETDLFARWGGEEFMILAVETSPEGAVTIAQKLRDLVRSHDFGIGHALTCSFGVTAIATNDTFDDLIRRADDALYLAKERGRDRVEVVWRKLD
ncbi:MAG: diguanylate cyclase [Campylobacterales bacterium]